MIYVLIVDDHALVRRGLKEVLEDEFGEITVGEADHVEQAADSLRERSWDVMLLDINLPGRSGLEFLEEIRRFKNHPPVVVLTAYAEEEFAVRAFQSGASAYLNKQRAPDELVAAVRKVLAGGQYVTPSLAEKVVSVLGGHVVATPHDALSARELQVLRMVAMDYSQKQIAASLKLSVKTVATYRARIGEKMGMHSNVELTRYAFHHKLVE